MLRGIHSRQLIGERSMLRVHAQQVALEGLLGPSPCILLGLQQLLAEQRTQMTWGTLLWLSASCLQGQSSGDVQDIHAHPGRSPEGAVEDCYVPYRCKRAHL